MLRIFRDIKSVSFLDIKSRYEIPAPLCGLVFVRFTPENFDAANAVLRMTYKGKCCANMDNFSVYKALFAPHTPLYVILSATERSGVQSKF